jgi:hypothetical protein
VGFSCAILYLTSRRNSVPEEKDSGTAFCAREIFDWLMPFGGIAALYTVAGTLLLALLLLDESATAAVGLAWGLFGLALLETAEALHDKPLLVQGRAMLLASFVRIFIADLNSTSKIGSLPVPMITVGLLAAIYYYAAYSTRDNARVRAGLLWFGTLSLAALLRFELPIEWVAVGWAVLAVATYAIGWKLRLSTFRNQCYAMTSLSGIRCAFDNFYQVGPWHFTNVRIATVVACALLMYTLFAATQFRHKGRPDDDRIRSDPRRERWNYFRMIWTALDAYPQHLFFFVPTILLTVLLSLEVRRGFLTAAWGCEGLIVFLAVLKLDERAYRWFSLLLFLLCVGRIVTVDVWNLDALGRIVSFMGLGLALLAVSFLYARHREILRRVL